MRVVVQVQDSRLKRCGKEVPAELLAGARIAGQSSFSADLHPIPVPFPFPIPWRHQEGQSYGHRA